MNNSSLTHLFTAYMADQYVLWSFSLLLFIIGLLLCHWMRNRLIIRKQRIRILRLQNELHGDRDKIEELSTRVESAFADTLSHMALATKLHTTRFRPDKQKSAQPPEKYHYLRMLIKKGLTLEEISEMLAISTAEASQLIRLAKIGTL